MQNLVRVLPILAGAMLATLNAAPAQDRPSAEILREIAAELPHRPQTSGATFQRSGAGAADPLCKLQRYTMTLASGSRAARTLAVLLDHKPANADDPVTLLTVLRRVTVDADGSPRTYHPADPHGTGTCTGAVGPDGLERYSGICALDDFASAHLLLFKGARKLGKGEFESPWQSMWPLIRDGKLHVIDLKQQVPTAPDGFYFFYWKERDLSAFFKREIIPQTNNGLPCLREGGYFVAATTLKQDGSTLPNGCAPSRFMDAETVPFFVLPDDSFGNARVGDIVVGRLEGAAGGPLVYGVVGDTGPIAQVGEASIAFNRALLSKSNPIMNEHQVDALDISGKRVTILVLGGTKTQLHGNYSPENIEQVGRTEFARWTNEAPKPTERLDACVRQFGVN